MKMVNRTFRMYYYLLMIIDNVMSSTENDIYNDN